MNREASQGNEQHPKERSKSTINEMIKSFITNKINQYLGKYLNNIKKDDLKTNIGTHSAITLTNLQLRKDAFDDLRLPIEVSPRSVVRELRCELRMIPTQVHINLKGVRAWVHPNNKSWSQDQWDEYKKKHLEEWEETQKHLFENLNMKSYKQRKLNMVANNINITIEDIIIHFEDMTVVSMPCAIRLRIEEFKIVTTSPDFTKEKVCSNESVTHRRVTIRDFSVAVKKKDGSDDFCEYSERMYMIRPCNIAVNHKMLHKTLSDQPVHTIDASISNLVLSINDAQRQALDALNVHLTNQTMYKTYEENKPSSSCIVGHEQKWWNYLIMSCKKDMDMNFVGLIRNKRNMDRYIDYYKSCQAIIHAPWLKDETLEKQEFLLKMENEYPLEKIIMFRTLALYQLRIEAMSYVKARGNVRGRTHLGDLWDYYLNDFESLLGDPYKKVAEEDEIELTLTEKEELNQLIRMDELNIVNSYLNGTSSSRNDKLVKVFLEIGQIRVFVQDTQGIDEGMFRTVPKSECVCGRCKEVSVRSEKNSPNAFEGFEKKVDGAVVSIIMVNSDGKSYDPKLVRESTLLVFEASLKASFMVFRDMHVETGKNNDKIQVNDIEIWDPLTLQDSSKYEHFKQNYGFSSASELLDSILEGVSDDFSLINSFRFFLQEYNLIPEFEFLIHSKGLTEKTINLCTCKAKADTAKGLKTDFFQVTKPLCLHLTKKQWEKYQLGLALDELYNEILTMFKKRVMPRFLRNCIRWIIGNTIKKSNGAKAGMKISVEWKGKSSPLQVQFNKIKKRGSGTEFDQIFNEKKIKVRGKLLKVCISTDTIHSLIKWTMKPEEAFVYQRTFKNSLSACHPKIEYIKSILNNIKKKGKQLYYILSDKKNQVQPEIDVSFGEVIITCMESMFSIGSNENMITVIKLTSFRYQPQKYQKDTKSESIRQTEPISTKIRFGQGRDEKYYTASKLDFLVAEIVCKEILVLRVEKFNLINRDCLMQAHPYLIEKISEMNVSRVEINVCEELLGFLGLVTTLDMTPIKSASRENSEIKAMKKKVFESDKEKVAKILMQHQKDHFKAKTLKKCPHCILSYRKICKTFAFNIGQANEPENGLQLKFFSFLNRDSIVLNSQVLTGISEETIFSSKICTYISEFKVNPIMKVCITQEVESRKFDPFEKSPIFMVEHKTLTNVPNQTVTCSSEVLPLYLLFETNLKKNEKIFDLKLWKDFEFDIVRKQSRIIERKHKSEEVEQKVQKKKHKKMAESCKDLAVEYNSTKFNIHSIEFRIEAEFNFPEIISIISSLIVFQQLYTKYQQSLQYNKQKHAVKIGSVMQIKRIAIKSICEAIDFELVIDNMLVKSLPSEKKTKILKKPSDQNLDAPEYRARHSIEHELSEKIETLIDATFCNIDSATIKLSNFLLKLNSFSSKVVNLFKQHKGLVNSSSQLFSSTIETVVTNSMSLQSVELIKSYQDIPLISIPYKPKHDLVAMECEITTKTHKLKQFKEAKIKVFPLFSYIQGKNLARLIKSMQNITVPLSENKISTLFTIPDKYIFHNMRFLEVFPYQFDVNFIKIFSELLLKKTRTSTITLLNLTFNNTKDFSIFTGKLKTLKFISNTEKYKKVLIQADTEFPISIHFTLKPSLDLYEFTLDNIQLVFLSKVVEENLKIYNYIKNKTKNSSDKEESKTSVKFFLTNSSILVPKSSTSDEYLLILFQSAEIQTFSSEETGWKLPIENQIIEVYEKELSLLSLIKEKQILCTRVKLEFHIVNAIHCGQSIADMDSAFLDVFIPIDPHTETYTLKNKVNIELTNTVLQVSLAKLKQLDDLTTSNLDEPLENEEKTLRSKNTKFKVKLSSGKLSISRWLTKPWDNMRIISVKQPAFHETANFVINELEEKRSESVLQIPSPFGLAPETNDSKSSFNDESEELNQVFSQIHDTAEDVYIGSSEEEELTNFMT